MTPNDLLASGIRMSTAMVHRLVDDLTPAEFIHQPAPGANCAAWIVGHLATTMNRALGRLGVEEAPRIPEDVAAKFQMTKQPAGKQDGLGDPKDLIGLLDDQATRLQAALRSLTDEALAGEPEVKPPGVKTRGEMLLFLSLHSAAHAGQLSTIRRSLGKPPLL